MKVYFTASIHGKQNYGKNYLEITKILKDLGCELSSSDVTVDGIEDRVRNQSLQENESAHARILRLLKDADVVVTEATKSSTAVGYEIAEALFMDKPVIVLYMNKDNKSLLLEGRKDEKLQLIEYNLHDLKTILTQSIREAEEMLDVRFNFFINPKLLDFLNWVSKDKQIPRSAYIRQLLQNEMEKNERYTKDMKG